LVPVLARSQPPALKVRLLELQPWAVLTRRWRLSFFCKRQTQEQTHPKPYG